MKSLYLKGSCINQKPIITLDIFLPSYRMLKSVKQIQIPLSFSMQWLSCSQFHLAKTWESLFQTSVKAFRLQEAEETIFV